MNKNKIITVCLEHRFYVHKGKVYTKLSFPYSYWKDYLSYFDSINIVARSRNCDKLEPEMSLVTGENVKFSAVPYYIGPKDFIKKLPTLIYSCYKISRDNQVFLLRSGNVTNIMWLFIFLFKKKYLREYPGNIYEGIIGLNKNTLKYKLIGLISHKLAKFQGKFSQANGFVSLYCQKIYRSSKPSYTFSSFNIQEISATKSNFEISNKIQIISLGRLEKEKGHINLIKAICNSTHKDNINLIIIGDGSQREDLLKEAHLLGVNLTLTGSLTNRSSIFELLRNSDIFVLPSFTEGMPRALLEAMTIGLPCLGSNVGGIPEVLPESYTFSSIIPDELTVKLEQLIEDEQLRIKNSLCCRKIVLEKYSFESQQKIKIKYWSHLYE